MSNNIQIERESEVTISFEDFLLVYNKSKDYWYIEFLNEDDDDTWVLENIYDLIGVEVKGFVFEEKEIEDIKKMVENDTNSNKENEE